MSTAIEGVVLNPFGFVPVAGVAVSAYSVDGYTEGSVTTDSNGRFRLSGLTSRNWIAKVVSSPPFVGNVLLLPNTVSHADLSSVLADQHHEGFIGLLDNASDPVEPDGSDRIRVTDDGIINADVGGEEGGVLALTIDQGQIDHGSIGGLSDDDHLIYAVLAGSAGGQQLTGGTGPAEDLTLLSTSDTTRGSVFVGGSDTSEFDESTGRLALPTPGSSAGLLLGDDALWYRVSADVLRTPDAVTVDGTLTGSGVVDFGSATSFELPNSATPTVNAVGEIALDTSIASFDPGIKFYDGANEQTVIALRTSELSTTDNHVIVYDSASGRFRMEAQAGGGGSQTPWTQDIDGDGFNLLDAGVIFLREQAEADADVGAAGQIWVNTATPNELYFTTDAGDDREIAYAGGAFHDGMSDFVANEHIDHTSITLTAGVGLSGGGDISAGRTFTLDLNELATETSIDAGVDFIAMVDATDSGSGKILAEDIPVGYDTETAMASGDFVIMVDITDNNAGKITLANFVNQGPLGAPSRTIVLTAQGGSPTTTAGCAGPTRVEAGTNDIDYWVLDFDTATDENAFWMFCMPDNYDGGTLTFRAYWTAASGSGTVQFELAARAYANSDAIDQVYGTAVPVTDTLLTAGDVHISPESAALTINGGPAGGELVIFRVERDVSDDTLGVDARLMAIMITYSTNAYSD